MPHPCAITGASGYLGSRLADYFTRRQWPVYALGRRAAEPARETIPWSLASTPEPDVFRRRGIESLVHCAWDFGLTAWPDIARVNVAGSVRLLEAARAGGVRTIVLISTMSAYDGCRSLYGRGKLDVERAATALGAVVIRPGLIYGDSAGGMVGSLARAVTRSRVIPLIGNGRYVLYLTHDEDLCELVLRGCAGELLRSRRPIIAAHDRGLEFREILRRLARSAGRYPTLVPLPWRAVWMALRLAEAAGLRPGFRSDSVLSLVNQDRHPDFGPTRRARGRFREFTATPPAP